VSNEEDDDRDPGDIFDDDLSRRLKEQIPKLVAAAAHAKKYPECTKLSRTVDDRRVILDFLEWLIEEKKFNLATALEDYRRKTGLGEKYLSSNEQIVFAYLEIDENKLETERRAILEEQRKMNKENA
jgi:hypothetical protein